MNYRFSHKLMLLLFLIKSTYQICLDSHCQSCSTFVLCDVCKTNYFRNDQFSCTKCQTACLTCTSASSCQTCNDGYYYVQDQACPACYSPCTKCSGSSTNCSACKVGYALINSECLKCQGSCLTCQSTITNCLTCVDSANQNPPNCTCGIYQYQSSNYSCLSCTKPCLSCSESSTSCLTCLDILQILPTCDCPTDYIIDSVTKLCCKFPCASCQNSQTECYSCSNTYTYNSTNHACNCQLNQFEKSGSPNVCQNCKLPCDTCQTSETYCLTCVAGTTLLNNECLCSDGYYYDINTLSCVICQLPCIKCTEINFCLTCKQSEQILNDCHCQDGKYLDANSECQTCILNCKKCTNSSNCQECNNNYYASNSQCLQCDSPCQNCVDSSTKCLSCINNLQTVINNECICNDGYYMDQSYLCQPCQYPCTKCELSQNDCQQCAQTFTKTNINTCICQDDMYLDVSQNPQVCIQCQIPCKKCQNNQKYCLSCIDQNQLLNQQHQCYCKSGYLINSNFQCDQCVNPCTECQGTINLCIKCKDQLQIAKNGECICPNNYGNDDNYICILCEPPCQTCKSTKNYCLTCTDINQKINQSNQCVCKDRYYQNSISTCKACSNNCQSCIDDSDCFQCLDGSYYFNQQCLLCDQNCQKCENNPTNCISCRLNYLLSSLNECQCKIGYFDIGTECNKCEFPCLRCKNNEECIQCASLQHLMLNQQKQCTCENGYYWSNMYCKACNTTCLTCEESENYCLSCDSSKQRIIIENSCECIQGYFENPLNQCQACLSEDGKSIQQCEYKDCSDGQWTYGEECDDGNQIIRDGCSNCKIDLNYSCLNKILEKSVCYQCPPFCQSCSMDDNSLVINCIECIAGYFNDNFQCTKCSDKCLNCFKSSNDCKECQFIKNSQGQCQNCESQVGFYTNYENNTCFSKCGDAIKASGEQCDDGNNIDGDGCNNNCELEKLFVCKDGICITPIYPQPSLSIIGDTSEFIPLRQFQLTYDQELLLESNFQIKNYLNFSILTDGKESLLKNEYQLDQQIERGSLQNQGNLILTINISFTNSSSDEQIIIKFQNTSQIKNFEGYSQTVEQIQAKIMPVTFISQTSIQQVQAATQSNSYVMYMLGTMAGGAVIFGGVDIFYNLLDTLQLLSYLKYINTQFPYNLSNYFDLFGFASLNFLQKYFDILSLLDEFIDYDKLKQPPPKIADDNLSSLFIINGSSIFVVWITLACVYRISLAMPKILNKIKIKYFSEKSQKQDWLIRLGLYYLSIKIFINKICYMIISEMFYSGILRTQIATAYDYSFSILLQIYSFDITSNDFIVQISQFLAVLALLVYMFNIYFVISISSMEQYAIQSFQNKQKYGSLFEGIKTTNSFNKCFNSIILIKKMIFMAILIFVTDFPLIQSASLFFISLIMSILLIICKPLEMKQEFIKQLASEINISLTLLTLVILVYDNEVNLFSYEIKQNFGWCCIFFITCILVIQVVIDAIQQWIMLIKKFQKIKAFIQSIQNLLFPETKPPANCKILESS